MEFSVNIETVYSNHDYIRGMVEVKRIGFHAIEIGVWWDKNLQEIFVASQRLQLRITGVVTQFISLTDPSKRQEYVEGLRQTIEIAKMLRCKTIISQVGQEIAGVPRREQHQSIVAGLKACVPFLEEAGMMLVIEPLNTIVDHPGYYLDSSKEGFQIVEQVASPYIKVLYDIYHMQIMEGNIISTIVNNIDHIGSFHIAGVPGRHEPYTGELYYINILKAIQETGFKGYVGLEYFPLLNPKLSLTKFFNWIKAEGLI
ncbi:hydroxypyruvate isomerase family protein [Metabacillus arenae]|uniref:TIM barrel protein n=1 Tax=Metabacillus arenae TaxID=2771434 RepID=A0A926NQ59_9BACI|nr:TIM barrel protein [Metabacillus arenae]MBD1382017.1 TIM barrel protein [Metabacillus arenae]